MEFTNITKTEFELIRAGLSVEWRKVAGYETGGRVYRGYSSVEWGLGGPAKSKIAVTLLHQKTPMDEASRVPGEEFFGVRIGGGNAGLAAQDEMDGPGGVGISREAMGTISMALPTLVDPVAFVPAPPAPPLEMTDHLAYLVKGGVPIGNISGDAPIGFRSYNSAHYDLFGEFEMTGGGAFAAATLSLAKGTSGNGGDYYIRLGKGSIGADPINEIAWHPTETLWPMPNVSFLQWMTSPNLPQLAELLPIGEAENLVVAVTARGTSGPTPQANVYVDSPSYPFKLTLA